MLILLMACVVKPYGAPPKPAVTPEQAQAAQQAPARTQVDYAAYEAEFAALLDEGGVQDQDRLDRLQAAHSYTLALRDGQDPDLAAERYLQALLEIEQREELVLDEGLSLPSALGGAQDIVEEDLIVEDTLGQEPSLALGDAQAQAREQLAAGDYAGAMSTLEPYQDGPLWDSVTKGLWQEAVDGFVRSERERAGHMFKQARALPAGDARDKQLAEVETLLVGLVTFYPESSYTEAIQENLELVRQEME